MEKYFNQIFLLPFMVREFAIFKNSHFSVIILIVNLAIKLIKFKRLKYKVKYLHKHG
jgi:hypothetical protein